MFVDAWRVFLLLTSQIYEKKIRHLSRPTKLGGAMEDGPGLRTMVYGGNPIAMCQVSLSGSKLTIFCDGVGD